MIEALLTTTIAGLATVLGGLLVIFVRGNLKPSLFSASLAFASGVMLLISFVEVYVEGGAYVKLAMDGVEEEHVGECVGVGVGRGAAEGHMHDGGAPFLVTMVLFLCGWLVACVMHGVLHWVTSDSHVSTPAVGSGECPKCAQETEDGDTPLPSPSPSPSPLPHSHALDVLEEEALSGVCKRAATCVWDSPWLTWLTGGRPQSLEEKVALRRMFLSDQSTFSHLGYFTALALTLHNIPEGMATFAAASNSPKFGVGLALAIGIHNVPEGLAVALPIYLGTGSMKKALLFTFISALAEPLGGLITYGILTNPSPWVYGTLFLLTAGIMFAITLKELLPTAYRYDPTNRVTSLFTFAGMTVMAAGLAIINIT